MERNILEKCLFCNETINAPYKGMHGGYEADCPCCGTYTISSTTYPKLFHLQLTNRQRANISGYLRENQDFRINTNNVDSLLKIPTPSFYERADKLLLVLERMTEYAGHFLIQTKSWVCFGWCLNEAELNEILNFLTETKRIYYEYSHTNEKDCYKIIADGWAHLEEIKKVNADSQQGFVAMWYDTDGILEKVYNEAIAKGIRDAGYKPHLVKNREHNGKIDDEIIAQIRRSRFVLVDFTGHRQNVYYEAGFAQGLGIEVFWTCRKEEIKDTHSDVRQYNCIDWTDKTEDDLKKFRRRIASQIEAKIGRGSYQQ